MAALCLTDTNYHRVSGENFYQGWDVSVSTDWLQFLESDYGVMPRDPSNVFNDTADVSSSDDRVYMYHCYDMGEAHAYEDSAGVILRYRIDSGAARVYKFRVDSCIGSMS